MISVRIGIRINGVFVSVSLVLSLSLDASNSEDPHTQQTAQEVVDDIVRFGDTKVGEILEGLGQQGKQEDGSCCEEIGMLCPVKDRQEKSCRNRQEDVQEDLPGQAQARDLERSELESVSVAPEGFQQEFGFFAGSAEAEGQAEVDDKVDQEKDSRQGVDGFGC